MNEIYYWVGGHALWALLLVHLAALISIDNSYHSTHAMTFRSALGFSIWYVINGLLFGVVVAEWYDTAMAAQYYAAYITEKALSVDNLVVFMMIFEYFGIGNRSHRHKVLYYGIAGAVVFRFIFITVGSAALTRWGTPVEIALGLAILYSAWRMARTGEPGDIDHEGRWYIRWTRHITPVTSLPHRGRFFMDIYEDKPHSLRRKKIRHATTLLLCAVAIELCDVMFAFDSVPTVLAIVREPLVVYAAMMYAILGLRSIYFVLEMARDRTPALKGAVIMLLGFVGTKLIMGAALGIYMSPSVSLLITLVVLVIGFIPWRKGAT
jgi:tellurite resistance protein TerC